MTNETRAERQEAAATRRRWITLAEVVAVAGVIIAALTLYNSWSERRDAEAEKVAARVSAAGERTRIDLTATVKDGGDTLLLRDARHEIQDVTVTFPKAIGVSPQHAGPEPEIEADWFGARLLKLTDHASDDRTGRLPVLVTVQYFDGDATRTGSGIYDLVWKTEGRFLRGRALKLEGLRVRERGGSQARVDALWGQEKP